MISQNRAKGSFQLWQVGDKKPLWCSTSQVLVCSAGTKQVLQPFCVCVVQWYHQTHIDITLYYDIRHIYWQLLIKAATHISSYRYGPNTISYHEIHLIKVDNFQWTEILNFDGKTHKQYKIGCINSIWPEHLWTLIRTNLYIYSLRFYINFRCESLLAIDRLTWWNKVINHDGTFSSTIWGLSISYSYPW